jgi:hypothetical protein
VARLPVLVGLVVLAAGCGGGRNGAETTTSAPATATTTPADPGKATIEAFAAAARERRADRLWGLLSSSTRERLGPLQHFRRGTASELTAGLGSIEDFRTIVSERITPEFGVVAIDGTRAGKRVVYAAALRLDGKRWKVELGGPAKIRPIGPNPDAREPVVAQIAAAVQGPGGAGTAVMYLDGGTVNPEVRGTSSNSTLFANFDPALDRGPHTVVLFTSDDREASATAWAFTVEKS